MLNIAFVATALILALVCQIVWWRMHRPSRQIFSIILLFPLVFLAVSLAGLHWGVLSVGLADYARLVLLYVSLVLTYAIMFSAIEIPSPALSIISYIADSGQQGRLQGELTRHFAGQDGMMDRLKLMEISGLIRIEKGCCELTAKGLIFAHIFRFGAQLFGLHQGG